MFSTKRYLATALTVCAVTLSLQAQSELDAFRSSQYDLIGTARFVSMGGAFGALGGDISSLSQNPAGIGVYRGSEIATTFNFTNTHTSAQAPSYQAIKSDKFNFSFDNLGYVATFQSSLGAMESFSVGFAYNRRKNFNRLIRAGYNDLSSSISNYIAAISDGVKTIDIAFPAEQSDNYNPYYNDNTYVPWLGVMGYAGSIIDPLTDSDNNTQYQGFFLPNTDRANADLYYKESGSINEYTFNFGGNVADQLYFGVGLGIIDMNYELRSVYSEYINWIDNNGGEQFSRIDLDNAYKVYGTGFNAKLGLIYRPFSFWRLGFAFHTPTFYSITERYQAALITDNIGEADATETVYTPYGRSAYDLRSPLRIIASTAFVLGNRGILSFDYEYSDYQNMQFSDDYGSSSYSYENNLINSDFRGGHTFRIGAEFRILPELSLRAGFVDQLSPIKEEIQRGNVEIPTAGTRTSYYLDKGVQNYSFGLGYRFSQFYIDGAYVYQRSKANLLAFSPIPLSDPVESQVAEMKTGRSSFVFTVGFKF